MHKQQFLSDESETIAFGKAISELLLPGMVVTLVGDLGAGKTTLTRGILRGLGITERVKSPTYTIVEPYETERFPVFHFDCYRLSSPESLWELGLENYFTDESVCLVEWPEKGEGALPDADFSCELSPHEAGRMITLTGKSQRGHTVIGRVK